MQAQGSLENIKQILLLLKSFSEQRHFCYTVEVHENQIKSKSLE